MISEAPLIVAQIYGLPVAGHSKTENRVKGGFSFLILSCFNYVLASRLNDIAYGCAAFSNLVISSESIYFQFIRSEPFSNEDPHLFEISSCSSVHSSLYARMRFLWELSLLQPYLRLLFRVSREQVRTCSTTYSSERRTISD